MKASGDRRCGWIRVPLMTAGLLWSSAMPAAHPLSTTSVTITADHPTGISVTVGIDADALIARLEAASSAPIDLTARPPASPDEKAARILALGDWLHEAVELRADQARVPLRIEHVLVDAVSDATVRFKSAPPTDGRWAGPHTITWRTSLTAGSYALTIDRAGSETVHWLTGNASSGPLRLEESPGTLNLLAHGVVQGLTHVVPRGLDHILFVVGLALLGSRRRDLLVLVTAFTVAHSLTLGLGLYRLVSVPSGVVEPLIAFSVAYVGIENLLSRSGFRSRRVRQGSRVGIVFAFGLLHGLGFAGVLSDLVSSKSALFATLVSFNVGVEVGQLMVIAATLLLLRAISVVRPHAERYAVRGAAVAVSVTGLVWTIERLAG